MKSIFAIQNFVINDLDANDLIQCISDIGYNHQIINANPFSNEIPDVDYNGPIIPYGGTNFIDNVKKQKSWTCWFNDNFNYKAGVEHYGKHMFNSDGVFMKVKDFSPSMIDYNPIFIRPNKDLKEFAGHVENKNSVFKWFNQIKAQGYTVNDETDILIAKPSRIDCEWRAFIVNGVVVDGSRYRKNHTLSKVSGLPNDVVSFIEKMIEIWVPSQVFVMDICQVNDEYSILEYGDFHSAGWYYTDKRKVLLEVAKFAEMSFAGIARLDRAPIR